MRTLRIPGAGTLRLEHLVLDLNGTLSDRGDLIEGVAERLYHVAGTLDVHLVTADTLGSARELGERLGAPVSTVRTGEEKAAIVSTLGANVTAAIGNGRNDEAMLRAAALGIAVIGPEGAATTALLAADVICRSVTEALDLLLEERLLAATLRP